MSQPVAALREERSTRGNLALVPAGDERLAGVIDLGSNSWRFVAYRYAPPVTWRRIAQLQEPVRIAHGLAATGALAAGRIAHGLDALEMFALARTLGIEPRDISIVATSALRDAVNGDDAIAQARGRDRPGDPHA